MRLESSFIQIDGIGEVTERRLWERGVTSWDAARDVDVLRRDQRAAVDSYCADARAALNAADAAFFCSALPARQTWRLADTFATDCAALDIETTGLDRHRDVVTTVSVADRSGVETLVRGRDLTRERLADLLADVCVLVTFNGTRFDIPFLERAFDLTIDAAHVDLLYPCRELGLSGGLKPVERELGIERAVPDVDGREAVELWYRYRDGDDAALDRLVTYNREDTRTLLPILDRVHDRLEQDVFVPHVPDDVTPAGGEPSAHP